MSPDLINSYLEIQKSADLSAATVFIQLLLPVPLPVLHPAFPDTDVYKRHLLSVSKADTDLFSSFDDLIFR